MAFAKKIFLVFALIALASKLSAAEEPAESKTESVIALTTDEFQKFVDEHPLALVEFYAPWYEKILRSLIFKGR